MNLRRWNDWSLIFFAAIAACLILWGSNAAGQAFDPAGVSPALLGKAGSGAADTQDPGTLWTNPAGISNTESQLAAFVTLHRNNTSAALTTDVNQSPLQTRNTKGLHVAPALVISHPFFQQRLHLAFGYRIGWQLETEYPLEYQGAVPTRYLGQKLDLLNHQFTLGAALNLAKFFCLGASFDIDPTFFHYQRSLWAGFSEDKDQLKNPDFDMLADFQATGVLLRGNIGLLFLPFEWLRIGIVVSLPTTLSLSAKPTLTPGSKSPSGYDNMRTENGQANIDFRLPIKVIGGISVLPIP
ncbi:MAG: outer membrane protein transport protein, partial [Pseudomonadota bacterium]